MKSFLLALILAVGSQVFASEQKLDVEVTSKDSSEKLCVVHLFDQTLAVEQRPSYEGSDELIIEFAYNSSGESSDRLSPKLHKNVSASSVRSLIVSRAGTEVMDLKTLLASNDLNTILGELLSNTPYSRGYHGTNANSIAETLRAQCK